MLPSKTTVHDVTVPVGVTWSAKRCMGVVEMSTIVPFVVDVNVFDCVLNWPVLPFIDAIALFIVMILELSVVMPEFMLAMFAASVVSVPFMVVRSAFIAERLEFVVSLPELIFEILVTKSSRLLITVLMPYSFGRRLLTITRVTKCFVFT